MWGQLRSTWLRCSSAGWWLTRQLKPLRYLCLFLCYWAVSSWCWSGTISNYRRQCYRCSLSRKVIYVIRHDHQSIRATGKAGRQGAHADNIIPHAPQYRTFPQHAVLQRDAWGRSDRGASTHCQGIYISLGVPLAESEHPRVHHTGQRQGDHVRGQSL